MKLRPGIDCDIIPGMKPHSRNQRPEYLRQRRVQRRKVAVEFLGGKCAKCGSKKELQFHHSTTKLGYYFYNMSAWSLDKLYKYLEEDKVILLCRTCHYQYHNS